MILSLQVVQLYDIVTERKEMHWAGCRTKDIYTLDNLYYIQQKEPYNPFFLHQLFHIRQILCTHLILIYFHLGLKFIIIFQSDYNLISFCYVIFNIKLLWTLDIHLSITVKKVPSEYEGNVFVILQMHSLLPPELVLPIAWLLLNA